MRYWKLAALCGLVLGGFTLGGCSDDDNKKKGGGGSTVFPSIPTARPDITGWPVVIDVSGRSSGPGTTGGNGGTIFVATGRGDIREDDGRSMPGINANFLTPAVLADNSVNYTELSSIDPAAVTVTGTTAVLDLVGMDFHLPAGATLNLSDLRLSFGLQTLRIRTFGSGDVIRIDGNVLGAPFGAFNGINVEFESLTNPGTAIAIGGTINLEPAGNNVVNGGNFSATADQGSILVRGSIISFGSQVLTGPGGNGGNVSLFADRGSVLLREAVLQANGGNGAVGGGNGGTINFLTPHHAAKQRVPWGFRVNGGNDTGSGGGGNAGAILLNMRSPLNLFAVMEANGGSSAGDNGGNAGACQVIGLVVQGVLVVHSSGGDGDDDGGSATPSPVQIAAESLTGVALVATRNGGTGTNGNGGTGGTATLSVDGRFGVNLLLDVTANGGDGDQNAGFGGIAQIAGFSEFRNANLVLVANGGSGDLAGNGGAAVAQHFSAFGEPMQVTLNVQANGGAGDSLAGSGGTVEINPNSTPLNAVINVTANGGALTGAPTAPGAGGNGGILRVGGSAGGAYAADLSVSGSLRGGDGGTLGAGGIGGQIQVNMSTLGGDLRFNTVGTFDLRGGTATAGNGGQGGFARVMCGTNGQFESNLLNLDQRGGDSASGNGGNAFTGGPAFEATLRGPAWFRGGTINISGGNGSTTSGTGNGGNWGRAELLSERHDIHFGATILANGGNGVSLGGGVSPMSAFEINSDSDADGIAGTIRVTGTLRTRGGDASDGVGGAGGFIYIHAFDTSTPISGGDTYISGLVECIGGTGAGTNGVGGQAVGIEISSAGNILDISGTVRLIGGDGPNGGSMGNMQIGASAITNIRISGTMEALGGTATGVAVSGPLIQISTPAFSDEAASITVTASAVIRSNGGAGGTTNGAAGFIEFDAQGAGTNVTIAGSATVECRDGAGVNVPANITIN